MSKQQPLGTLIDQLDAIREKKRALNEKLKEVEVEYSEKENEIRARLAEQGIDKCSGKKATVSLSEVVVGTVTDWDKAYAYIKKTGHFHLLQRRVSDPAFRELFVLEQQKRKKAVAANEVIPGFEPFTKINLNLRSLKAAA